jgi:2-amino-4-hydroxy-6-hydroxymethyldihydropteridine diphosphokinase
MALIIATGSNMGDRFANLKEAKARLAEILTLTAESRIYISPAVDYISQPDFANQVLQFALPWDKPENVMHKLLQIEHGAGRTRDILRGPRVIDIDILFWGLEIVRTPSLTIPHPRWNQRSFVVRPLSELPFFHAVEKCFTIPTSFEIEATPI